MDNNLALVNQMAKSTNGRQMRIALLAYKSDKEIMNYLIDVFRENKVLCWTEEQILGGERRFAIAQAYEEADFILILLSQKSIDVESGYQARIKAAVNASEEMPESGIKLIPVTLDDCRIPMILRDFHPVDLRDKSAPIKLVKSFATEWDRRNRTSAWTDKEYKANWE